MMAKPTSVIVAVAFAHIGEVRAWLVDLDADERELLHRTLVNLYNLGHLANFSVVTVGSIGWVELVEQLSCHCSGVVVESCWAEPIREVEDAPAFLMPVWPFDHEFEGAPAATSRLLGLDLQIIATLSHDEEIGAKLPGHSGRWLIHARPMF